MQPNPQEVGRDNAPVELDEVVSAEAVSAEMRDRYLDLLRERGAEVAEDMLRQEGLMPDGKLIDRVEDIL